jgi:hypothetical protein
MAERTEDFTAAEVAGMRRLARRAAWLIKCRCAAVYDGRVLFSDVEAVAMTAIAEAWRRCPPDCQQKHWVTGAAMFAMRRFVTKELSSGVKWLPDDQAVVGDCGSDFWNSIIDRIYAGPRCSPSPDRIAAVRFFIEDVREKLGEESAQVVSAVLKGEPRQSIRARVHHQRFYRIVAGISELFQRDFCGRPTLPGVAARLERVASAYRRRDKMIRQNEANGRCYLAGYIRPSLRRALPKTRALPKRRPERRVA